VVHPFLYKWFTILNSKISIWLHLKSGCGSLQPKCNQGEPKWLHFKTISGSYEQNKKSQNQGVVRVIPAAQQGFYHEVVAFYELAVRAIAPAQRGFYHEVVTWHLAVLPRQHKNRSGSQMQWGQEVVGLNLC
jgi:hypothetical protein